MKAYSSSTIFLWFFSYISDVLQDFDLARGSTFGQYGGANVKETAFSLVLVYPSNSKLAVLISPPSLHSFILSYVGALRQTSSLSPTLHTKKMSSILRSQDHSVIEREFCRVNISNINPVLRLVVHSIEKNAFTTKKQLRLKGSF